MFTIIVMTFVVVWAIKNIARELGVNEAVKERISRRKDDED